jgi:NifU-like protein
VSRGKIERIIRENHLTTTEEVTNYLKAGGGCGSCLADIDDLVDEVNATVSAATERTDVEAAVPTASVLPGLTNLEKITRIQRVIEDEVRPLLALDGGDLELHDIQGDRVQVVLKGSCHNCASVMTTLKLAIEKTLRDRVSPDLIVEAL